MKETIAKIPMLVHPNFKKTFYIHVDTSKKDYGTILTQHPNDPLDKPAPKRSGILKKHEIVTFASLALPKTYTKYMNSEWKCYEAYWAINKFKKFIMGRDVVIFSDYQSLVKLCNSTTSTSRSELICGWLLKIAVVVNQILHWSGKTLVIPDTLSQAHHVLYQDEDIQTPLKEVLERLGVSNVENKTTQKQTKMAILELCFLSKSCYRADKSTELHLQLGQFVDLNKTAGEVSTPWKLVDVIAHLSSQTASTWLSSIVQTFNCWKKTKKNINYWKNNFDSQKKSIKILTIKKITLMVKKKQQRFWLLKK